MNLTNAKIEKKSADYARALLKHARENEPQITADLQKIALEVMAEMVGLEHKFKTEESLTKKLSKNSQKYLSYISAERNSDSTTIEKSVARAARQSNDVLRYTFLMPFEK